MEARELKEVLEKDECIDVKILAGWMALVVGYNGRNWMVTTNKAHAEKPWKGQIEYVECLQDVYKLVGLI